MVIYLTFSILILISIARGYSKSLSKTLTLAASCLLALSAIIVIIINVVLLFQLNPLLQPPIMPENIHMGFIGVRELNRMKGDNDMKSINGQNVEVIGRLSDLLERKNSINAYMRLFLTLDFVWPSYRVNIECPNRFYQDCNAHKASDLTIDIQQFFNKRKYPTWSCVVNTEDAKCASKFTELISSNYTLILYQPKRDYDTSDENLIEPAWAGLSKYNIQPKFELAHSTSVNPCSDSNRLSATSLIKYISLSFIAVSFRFYS